MGFRKDSYASLWSVEPKSDRFVNGRISIDRKNKDTGEYERSFNGFVGFAGSACAAKAARLKPTDGKPVRIKLIDVDVTNTYDKEKKITYWNPVVYSFETEDEYSRDKNQTPAYDAEAMMAKEAENSSYEGDPVDDEGLPW